MFNYLRTYQALEKEKWAAKGRGTTRPRRLEFTLNDDDTKWVREMWDKCLEELRAATGNVGFRAFQDTVSDLLDREKAWVSWTPLYEMDLLGLINPFFTAIGKMEKRWLPFFRETSPAEGGV